MSIPFSKYLLYQAAIRLFGSNTAAMAEPISATFARGIVDQNNNLVLSPAQLAALVALLSAPGQIWTYVNTNFTAVAGNNYLIDTSGAPVTVTMPESAADMDTIQFADAKLSWQTNNVTFNRNGLNINGGASNYIASVEGNKLLANYVANGSYGWSFK